MATINKDNIVFSDVKNRTVTRKGVGIITHADNVSSGKYVYDPESEPVVMALDIDWNGAQFANAVAAITEVPDAGEVQSNISSITTTGELISIVAKQQKQIDALITMVKGLYASLVS